jgi:hypothetical protein
MIRLRPHSSDFHFFWILASAFRSGFCFTGVSVILCEASL